MSTSREVDEPLAWYEITEVTSTEKKWVLSLYSEYARLESADGQSSEVDRAELHERVQTIDNGLFRRKVMTVTLGKKKVFLRLSEESYAAVRDWIGPPTFEDLKLTLKRRLGWVIPLGLMFVLTALPVGAVPGDPVSLGLGLTLILTGALAKWWPHRMLFALDSLWFSFLAANSIWILLHEWGWLRLVLLLVQLMLVQSGWREYRRFAPERMESESPENEML